LPLGSLNLPLKPGVSEYSTKQMPPPFLPYFVF
jgi:hypothetical protein